ncbi:MAG TPA: 3-phosphoserine/phosphohydroxythreonine transaminase [Deltaproteobacteria bacterium]|nr:3-phosphoserine/phosphohydroxythreonine transaminase [Deltaproteobacteria bacterium]
MARIHNFSAGPAVLPEPVLRRTQAALWEYGDSGLGIAECSHRSALFEGVIQAARERITRLLHLDEDQVVLFLQGGARSQFYMWPANVLRGGRAVYLNTGRWADLAAADAARYGTVHTAFSSKEAGWDRVPSPGEISSAGDGAVYLHYTSNNTVAGTEFSQIPDAGGAILACDMSSNFLSRPIDGSRFGFVYAGAQKNLGPSGVTVVIVRRSLLPRMDPELPAMLQYAKQVERDSMLNTPCTFGIYVIGEVCRWLEEDMGGLRGIESRNIKQSERIYAEIDRTGFWKGKVARSSRSRMNVTFSSGDAALDTAFHTSAAAGGLSGLKGHSSVGGLRASLYNAQTDEAVDALVEFMRAFEQTHG